MEMKEINALVWDLQEAILKGWTDSYGKPSLKVTSLGHEGATYYSFLLTNVAVFGKDKRVLGFMRAADGEFFSAQTSKKPSKKSIGNANVDRAVLVHRLAEKALEGRLGLEDLEDIDLTVHSVKSA
jgi:hypothetical protein